MRCRFIDYLRVIHRVQNLLNFSLAPFSNSSALSPSPLSLHAWLRRAAYPRDHKRSLYNAEGLEFIICCWRPYSAANHPFCPGKTAPTPVNSTLSRRNALRKCLQFRAGLSLSQCCALIVPLISPNRGKAVRAMISLSIGLRVKTGNLIAVTFPARVNFNTRCAPLSVPVPSAPWRRKIEGQCVLPLNALDFSGRTHWKFIRRSTVWFKSSAV